MILEYLPSYKSSNFLYFHSSLFSRWVMSDSLQAHELQHARLPCPSPSPGVHSNTCSFSWWCHPTISSCLPFLLLPLVFSSISLFQWVSCLHQVAKILELQFQHQSLQWVFRIIFLFFLGLTGLTSMLSGGLSRVFFGTTIQKHQFFSVQPSLWSKSHIPSMGIPDHLTYLLRNL